MANSFSSDDLFWQTGVKQHLSRMVLDLPQSSQVKMEFGETFVEVRVDISPVTAEKPPPTRRKRHLPPSKVNRNRRRLLKFLEKGMQPDETQASGHTPAAVAAPDDPQEGGQAPAVTEAVEDHPPIEDVMPPSVTENLSSPASENTYDEFYDKLPKPIVETTAKHVVKPATPQTGSVKFKTKHVGKPATPYIPPHLRHRRTCLQVNPAHVSTPLLLTQRDDLAQDPANVQDNTNSTGEESADKNEDPVREDVPTLDGTILQPVEDAVLTPSPAGNHQCKAASSRKIAKVRRKKCGKSESWASLF